MEYINHAITPRKSRKKVVKRFKLPDDIKLALKRMPTEKATEIETQIIDFARTTVAKALKETALMFQEFAGHLTNKGYED